MASNRVGNTVRPFAMKARLQTSLGQQLVLTPQLRQSLHLLQLSAHELEAELAEAVESNPLLDWAEPEPVATESAQADDAPRDDPREAEPSPEWERSEEWPTSTMRGSGDNDADQDAAERVAASETLHDYLQWQLQLSHLSPRQLRIGIALVDAIDDDGYLRETTEAISTALAPDIVAGSDEVLAVLRQLQRLDPPGVGARDLGECLSLQLDALPAATPGRELALQIATGAIERLPRIGRDGLARELQMPVEDIDEALHLLRSLDPRPGARHGDLAVVRSSTAAGSSLADLAGTKIASNEQYFKIGLVRPKKRYVALKITRGASTAGTSPTRRRKKRRGSEFTPVLRAGPAAHLVRLRPANRHWRRSGPELQPQSQHRR